MRGRRFLALLLTWVLTITALPLETLAADAIVSTGDINTGESMPDEEMAESVDNDELEDEKETYEEIEDDAESAADEIEVTDESVMDDLTGEQTEDDNTENENIERYAEVEGELAAAENTVMSGKCGDNLTWEIKDGVMTVSGTGDMWDYEYYYDRDRLWENAEIDLLVLEDGITRIGEYAFYDCSGFTGSLMIPDSVTEIDNMK